MRAFPMTGESPAFRVRGRGLRIRWPRIHPRLAVFLGATLYFVVYAVTYVVWVAPLYDSWGLGIRDDLDASDVVLLWALAVTPSLFLRARFVHPSDFLRAIQYVVVYVPATWVAMNSSRPVLDRHDAWGLILVLFIAMTAQAMIGTHLPVRPLPVKRLQPRTYVLALFSLGAIMMVYLVSTIGASFRLVGLDEIYELRTLASEAVEASGSALSAYTLNWLSSLILPLILAIGLFGRRKLLIGLAVAGYLVLYGLWGSKATLLAPPIIVAIYLLVRNPARLVAVRLMVFCCCLLAAPVVLFLFDEDLRQFAMGWYVSLAHQRTFSSSALLLPQYLDFFQHNPLTYGSHISGINALITYPYDMDVPRSVGNYQYGGPMTANVNYWGQDGIAAFGLAGVPLIAALAILVYWLLDCASARLDARFATVSVAFIAMQLSDTSLFTSFVTGGLGLMIVSLALLPANLFGRVSKAPFPSRARA